ncbi:hypothetical protein M2146_002570 [Lachnospiraceae bacterium PF1-22]
MKETNKKEEMYIHVNDLAKAIDLNWDPEAFAVGDDVLSVMNKNRTIEACIWIHKYPVETEKSFFNFQVSDIDYEEGNIEVTNIHYEKSFDVNDLLEDGHDYSKEEIIAKIIDFAKNWVLSEQSNH